MFYFERFRPIFLLILPVLLLTFVVGTKAQTRDYLTYEEIELVRKAQQIDERIEVLVKAIDRRFIVLNKESLPADKKSRKANKKWGELPTGTQAQLFSDIEKILQKAIDDIDDLASNEELYERVVRDGNNTNAVDDEVTLYKIKSNKKYFPIAVHNLADASRRYIPILQGFYEKASDGRTKGVIYGALENCNLIIEASSKVPKLTKKDLKKKKNKKKKDKN